MYTVSRIPPHPPSMIINGQWQDLASSFVCFRTIVDSILKLHLVFRSLTHYNYSSKLYLYFNSTISIVQSQPWYVVCVSPAIIFISTVCTIIYIYIGNTIQTEFIIRNVCKSLKKAYIIINTANTVRIIFWSMLCHSAIKIQG